PLNNEKIIELAKDCRAVVTAEEHSVIGGLGGAIAEALRQSCKPIDFVGIEDVFGCSALNYQDLLEHYGLTKEAVEKAISKLI
ncbi:MAG: transketolase family protein, partial [Clostridiales bacterium]|nr:transketolase family protein [Clostridiales bacterium]